VYKNVKVAVFTDETSHLLTASFSLIPATLFTWPNAWMNVLASKRLNSLRLGDAVTFKNWTMFPVPDGLPGEPDELNRDNALQAGLVSVAEVHDAGVVN
jgi:hypothetical protein